MDAIKKRRAIRKYKPDTVPAGHIERLLEAARLAPSGVNSQPWKFKVVTDADTRRKVFEATRNQKHVGEAPCVIVVCADTMSYHKELQVRFNGLIADGILTEEEINEAGLADVITDKETDELKMFEPSASFNTAIATEHICLMAAELGLGTCWVHLFDKQRISELFDLPPWIIPVTLLPVGYPDEDPEPRPRKSIEEITL
jgi:nitroreductase